ncbi:CAP domain-containing protein [Aporhodopirellula aestuarii]|uniref:CAP domain-containing protein n=1 Tax=Aporhodopirellula aestuarii TaxID=2950107 RepID=A0ABT0U4Z0_9BACT|nr:CAP domain-containing protein [Aporhodopirellula aestuarii]MCM2371916.1 CAP domain-containing protein [Aporhodopirellula aestuarii]
MRRYLITSPILILLSLTQTTQADSPRSSLLSEVEKAIVVQTNEFRQKHNLPKVEQDETLTETASKFANFMAENSKYGHHADGKTPAQRAKEQGYQYCVVRENIAYRTNTGEVTADSLIDVFVQGWIDSPPHRENMLADYITETGVAVATSDDTTYYAVQLFGRPKSAAIQIKVTNQSEETQTLSTEANDSSDEFQMPPRSVVTMTRCFPTTLRLNDDDTEVMLKESTELAISDGALMRKQ